MQETGKKNWPQFLIPSGIGVLFFLTPMVIDGQVTVGMAYVGDLFIGNGQTQLQWMAGCFTFISSLAHTDLSLFRCRQQTLCLVGRRFDPAPHLVFAAPVWLYRRHLLSVSDWP
jgi:hypothetical protein